jgi:type II secretory ATPase GspE/PulE/Tfp pilus assembly ATPase PilB-like protein
MAVNTVSLVEEGKRLYDNGSYNEALECLIQVYGQGNKDLKVLYMLVDCLEKLEMPLEMADFLAQAIVENKYDPKDQAELYYRLGMAYAKLGKYNQARLSLWQIRKLDPNYPGLDEKLQELNKSGAGQRGKYDLLLEKGLISQEKLDEALKRAEEEKLDPDQLLVDEYQIDKESLGESLSVFYDAPFVPFDPDMEAPFEVFNKRNLDADFLKKYGWVPLAQKGNTLEVLMTDPYDLGKIDEIRFILGTSNIESKVALRKDIEAFIDHFFQELSGEEKLAAFDEEVETEVDDAGGEDDFVDLEEGVSENDSEVVRLVNAVLVEAYRQGASDIHIEPNVQSKYCSIRYRVDGSCFEFRKLRLSLARPIISRVKIMSHLDIAEKRLPQDGKVKMKLPKVNKVVEFRVATIPTIDNQEDVVLRVLASGKPLPLDKLGMQPRIFESFQKSIYQPYGMVLVVGPTGSGKSTTLHSALSYINTQDRKIWTAEDPVEITQEGLRQVQMKPKIGLTFPSALRSFLRADPDVIMIGEMRDRETAHIGVEASLTGHLLLSTLHTNSAPETVTRLLDMDLDPFNFSDSLLCVLAQRLAKTLCDNCKEPYTPSSEEIEELKMEFGDGWQECMSEDFLNDPVLYRPVGCKRCLQGYKGRIGVYELMTNTPDLKSLIKHSKSTEELRDQAIRDGMWTLKQDGVLKVVQGKTDIHQIRAVAG